MWTLAISLCALALSIASFFFLRAYIKRRTDSAVILDKYRNEINAMLADLDRFTERDATLIEERVKKLKSLIEETDRRIGVLLNEVSSAPPLMHQERTQAVQSRPQRPGKARTEKKPPKIIRSKEQISPIPLPLNEQISQLLSRGAAPEFIARELNLSIAEVELAIAINKQSY
jgi:hypothetical protein